jgi:thiol-disulfide isomerase/thioredoxin
MIKKLGYSVLVLGILLSNVAVAKTVYSKNAPKELARHTGTYSQAPEFSLKDLNGKTVKSSKFKGKIIILNFWATWCPPCVAEIPFLNEISKKYKNQVEVVGVSLDQGNVNLKAFVSSHKIPYTILKGSDKVVADFGPVNAIPVTIIIDQDYRIIDKSTGYHTFDQFEAKIKPLLK